MCESNKSLALIPDRSVTVLGVFLAALAGPSVLAEVEIISNGVSSGGGSGSATTADSKTITLISNVGGLSDSLAGATGSPALSLSGGHLGSEFTVENLVLSAASGSVAEVLGATAITGVATLDDGTTVPNIGGADLHLQDPPAAPMATVEQGNSIVTAGPVGGDTVASVAGSYWGATADASVTVLNSIRDNFGVYAGDGYDDGWQVRHGVSNPVGDDDSDGDGIDLRLEEAFNLDPNVADVRGLPTGSVVSDSGMDYLSVTYQENKFSLADIMVVRSENRDLNGNWLETGFVEVSRTMIDESTETVVVRRDVPLTDNGGDYVRVEVSDSGE